MKRKWAVTTLWLMVLIWLTFCFYLSWQLGDSTTQLSQKIAYFLLELLGHLGLSPEPQKFHESLRLFAHFGVFFVTGLLVANALIVMFSQQKKRFLTFCVAGILCILIAVLAEVGKLRVPGRHLTWSETGLNVLGEVSGIVVVLIIKGLKCILRVK